MKAMPKVYFGSMHLKEAEARESLPAKLQRILAKFDLSRLCRKDRVPIKMHLGGDLGYTTIHPLLVRILVQAIKDVGGKPFVVDGCFEPVAQAAARGYTQETLGCPIVSAGGPYDSHWVSRKIDFPGLEDIQVFGVIWDAPCLINLSHVKGHGNCAYAGACKNIAMGCVAPLTRAKIHELSGRIVWHKERCTACGLCVKACDTGAISMNARTKAIEIFWHDCRFCAHCVNACPHEALTIRDEDGARNFQEGMAVTTKTILDSYEPSRVLHINILTNISQLCDCWGFSGPSIVPDIGILASHDMVAVEIASLKAIQRKNFIPGTLIGRRKLGAGRHLLQQIHGKDPFAQLKCLERNGVGQSRYKNIEVP